MGPTRAGTAHFARGRAPRYNEQNTGNSTMKNRATWIKVGLASMGMMALLITVGATAASGSGAVALTKNKVGGTYNFTANEPNWNAGNLCTPSVNGSSEWCSYTGATSHHRWSFAPACGGGCTPSLTYNFSVNSTELWINISGLSSSENHVFLNLRGDYDVITLNLSGCRGGAINVTLTGQHDIFNLNVGASGSKVILQMLEDDLTYNGNITGSYDAVYTTFAGAAIRQNACPWANASRTDSASAVGWGWQDYQELKWANAAGYNTNLSFTPLPGTNTSWTDNAIGWQNTTAFACHWQQAPACTGSGGSGWGGWAVRKAE